MSNSPAPDMRDVSMVDVSNTSDSITTDQKPQDVENEPPARRKSTMILTEENEAQADMDQGVQAENNDNDQMHIDQAGVSEAQKAPAAPQETMPDPNVTLPIDIRWTQGGEKVYITGSFTGWRKMIGLAKQQDNSFLITLGLPIGTHRFRFVIDNELRFSDFLPTATDQMGNFVNYVEVTPEHVNSHLEKEQQKQLEEEELQQKQQVGRRTSVSSTRGRSDSMWGLTNDDDDMGNGYSRYHDGDSAGSGVNNQAYISDIPPIFTDPKVMEQYYIAIDKQAKNQNGQQQAWLHPPQLPPHLENVILNNFNSMDRDNNSGALPIPNHVVLNHLATTSIKHNTLAVASIVRYKRKYVTQVLYAPLQQ
ncbi:unnamed protein product [Debaryomyces tyrocola]|nr:unnamed protein product [Debaryomyces tyrocola]